MAEMVGTLAAPRSDSSGWRAQVLMLGIGVFVAAAGLAVYAAYGDPHPKANQESGVPSVIVAGALIAVVVFGVLVPRGLRAIREEGVSSVRWGLTHSIVALVLTPAAFWSGVPLIVGAAGVWLGRDARDQREAAGSPTNTATAAVVVGLIAIVGSVVMTILGNTLLSRS